MARSPSRAPLRATKMLPPDTVVTRGGAGRWFARSPHPLGRYPDTLTERLPYWADRAPDRTFLAARDESGGWSHLRYRDTLNRTRSVAQALLDRRLSADRPVVILSGNGLDHAILALAAMFVGIPYAPIAPSYSLVSRDHQRLRYLWDIMRPGLVFAADGERFDRALASLPGGGSVEVVTVSPRPGPRSATPFGALLDASPTSQVEEAQAQVGPDTIAKVLFTSGSTGSPKGVINTQRMLSANQEQIRTVMAFLADEPPVLCDWLPWNHTFGGNHNFGLALYNGGSLYIDAGAPTPAAFPTTCRNLRDVATTAYFNVPKGFELLLPALKSDATLRRQFFSRLQMLFYAAAGLRQEIVNAFEDLAIAACGRRIPWVTGLGATESAPFAVCTGAMGEPVAGRIGVPVPGVELKVETVGTLLEARVRGPNITPGYWRNDALTRDAFDSEGYYRMGDAVDFVDPRDPARGFLFQGRLTEDFKLSTGTWVHVGPLRTALLAHFGDLVQDVVIAGHDRDDVRILVFPNLPAWRIAAGLDEAAPPRLVLESPGVRERFRWSLAAYVAEHETSSTRVAHAILLEDPPSIDAHEVTDKGSLNQKAVLRHRRALVDQLYGRPGPGLMIAAFEERADGD